MDLKSSSLLNYITSSDARKNIIYRLSEKPLLLSELRELLDVSSPYLVPRIKELQSRHLIYKDKGKYHLTFIGEMMAKKLRQIDRLFNLLEGCVQFFNDHDWVSFPDSLLDRVGDLGDCRLIKNSMEDINAIHREVGLMEILMILRELLCIHMLYMNVE